MEILMDLHTHTLASGHAYSTVKENIDEAAAAGLKALGVSDHAVKMPEVFGRMYLDNIKVLPDYVGKLRILKGVEANIIDYEGRIDVEMPLLSRLDYMIASLHIVCIEPGSVEQNTNALIKVMDNPYVTIIGHPDDDRFPIDLEEVVKAASQKNKALELNNSSLLPNAYRKGARKNIIEMLRLAQIYNTNVILGTDSHICYQVGKFDEAKKLLEEVDFPEELIINCDLNRLDKIMIHCS